MTSTFMKSTFPLSVSNYVPKVESISEINTLYNPISHSSCVCKLYTIKESVALKSGAILYQMSKDPYLFA